ncbi:MAG: hypothetical protein M0R37_14090, partial [Bacteroidales bacterium]|nr:hypothetical protein [Bacteroidales bacterium]
MAFKGQAMVDAATDGITLNGVLNVGENSILLKSGLSDLEWTGITEAGTAGASLAFGDLVYLNNEDSKWELADAGEADAYDKKVGICVLTAAENAATEVLLFGKVRCDALFPTMTVGNPVYMSDTAGDITGSAPANARIVGYSSTADELFFCPTAFIASGGASAFTDLTDVPAAYTGHALKVVRVKATEDGLEFSTAGAGDVVGPAGATDGHIAAFDTATGKLLKDGGVLGTAAASAVGDFATAAQGSTADTAVQPEDLEDMAIIKCNLVAVAAPTVNDDLTLGYAIGSIWIDTSTDTAYVCLDATDEEAVWQQTTLTAAQMTVIGNTSGTNSGNETATSIATIITGVDGKTTPADADTLPIIDSEASSALKELTWANVKATLKTYFDTLYVTLQLVENTAIKLVAALSADGKYSG